MGRTAAVRAFVITAIVLAVPALLALGLMDRFALHAAFNTWHHPLADVFFRYITHLADGLVPTVLALLLLFIKDWRSSLLMGLSFGISAIITQTLKRLVFPHMFRPIRYRDELGDMQWVLGADMHHHFSFPSGHATTAFAMCLALAVIVARPAWGIVLAVVAGLLAFSRVYLSQHFTEDIVAGATIGTLTAVMVSHWLCRSAFAKRTWLARRPF